MWAVMMIAMMMPSLAPTLWRYREAVAGAGGARPDHRAALAGLAYFLVWTAVGIAIFPTGVSLAALEMEQPDLARCVPIASGVMVLLAGVFQCLPWKEHHLGCCREAARGEWTAGAASAWRFGLRLGLHCSFGCIGLTAILLVLGVMDLRVMISVTAAITAERLSPNGARVARVIGAAVIAAGLYLIARAAGAA
jgi:predicted metal-binding membrane protein